MRKIIYLGLSFLLLATLITLHILGSKERVGYLSDFEIIEGSKSNYIYNFRIRYYDKVFINSDIYGVYLITNSLPEYIKEIKMKELGGPFGIIISDKIIEEEKIDNIKYILRLKNSLIIFVVIIVDFIILFDFIKFELLQLFIKLKNMYILISILFLCFLIMPNIIYRIFYKNFDHTNYENRTFASSPILVSTNINEYPKKYEEYFNDYLPFRNELVKLKNLNDIKAFNNLVHKDLILGKEKMNNIGKDYININNIFLQRIDNAENTPSLAQLASLRNSKLYKYDTEYIISNYTKYKYKLLTNYRWEYISCESDSKDNTSIVMIRDSFADNIFDYMSTRFSKTSYIIANGDSYSISNIIKTNPNIVIYLSVERYFKHRILYEYMTLFNR